VVHACNPSYSGGIDQEDPSSKPAQANSSGDAVLKIPNAKKGWRSGFSNRACEALSSTPVPLRKKKLPKYVLFTHGPQIILMKLLALIPAV
jgi:hypothetical protein